MAMGKKMMAAKKKAKKPMKKVMARGGMKKNGNGKKKVMARGGMKKMMMRGGSKMKKK